MKKWNRKQVIGMLSILLVAAIAIGGVAMLVHHQKLRQLQNDVLAELERDVGLYDEQSIVLYETSKAKAEELASLYGAKLRITADGRFATLTLPEGTTIRDVYAMKQSRKYLQDMSADYHVSVSDLDEDGQRLPQSPKYYVSDADYALQTYLDYLNMGDVWYTATGAGVTVAVIDTGIDTSHPEFLGRISEYSYNASEDKVVKDWNDWSLIEDTYGHGTAVTGVIAAPMHVGNVVGIAPNAEILVIKVACDENGNFLRASDLVYGIYYAIEQNVDVINMSFGGTQNLYEEAIRQAYDNDILCVAAAGNKSTPVLTYPAANEHVIGVGALGNGWELANYSNYGENTMVVAPGTTHTTLMGGTYGNMTGTSLAAPIVTGAIALLMQTNRYMSYDQVTEILYASCYDLGEPGRDWYYGFGAVDISALILEERGTITFDMLADELENMERLFIQGHTLQEMPEPERLYAVFDGWYYDDTFTQECNYYADAFHGEVTLYAKWANEEDGIPYTYEILSDGTVKITGYTGSRKYITIPEQIEGHAVSAIGDRAFEGQTQLREVTLPATLAKIGEFAFGNCANMVQMRIPESVTDIGSYAFAGCVRLYSVAFQGTSRLVSIGDSAFANCGKLERIDLPASLETLGDYVFYGATALRHIGVQQGNTFFQSKEGVLYNISGRTLLTFPAAWGSSYTIPAETTTIAPGAFAYAKLRTIDFGNVTSIGMEAFYGAELKKLTIPDTITSIGVAAFKQCTILSEVTIGRGVKEIPSEAFASTGLKTITIPNHITILGAGAFEKADLERVVFEENSSLLCIGASAFYDCVIREIDIPASVLEIGRCAFSGERMKYALVRVGFAENSLLHTIDNEAFAGCMALQSVQLPNSLRTIGAKAFAGCESFTETMIPAGVTSLGEGVFAYCSGLSSIEVAEGNGVYHDIDGVVYTIDNSRLCAYPAGRSEGYYLVKTAVRTIMPYTFAGAMRLNDVGLPDGLAVIGEYALAESGLSSISLPTSLQEISRYAFYGCEYLSYLSMPDNLQRIGQYAFAGCWRLQTICFNETSTLAQLDRNAFALCGITDFRVPANVSSVSQGAFEGCVHLNNVTFAANSKLETVTGYLFSGCSNLKSITFEQGSALKTIQAHGFEGMTKLTYIDFGNAKVTEIGNFAFRNCESLVQLNLPETVTGIGRYTFYGCKRLAELWLPASVEHIGSYAFLAAANTALYFDAEVLPAYLDENWDYGISGYYLGVLSVEETDVYKYAVLKSGNIGILEYYGSDAHVDLTKLDFGGTITTIGTAFKQSAVKTIVLPETVTTIQAEAFADSDLEQITIPASVTFIGRKAFANTKLHTLHFADNAKLSVIEQYAFQGTKQLKTVSLPASVTKLGTGVFYNSGLATVHFASDIQITEIPERAFAGTNLTSIALPDSIAVIGYHAFNDVQTLQTVTFGNSDHLRILDNAFYRTGLTSVHIPASVTYIGEYSFVALEQLTAFTVDESNSVYKAEDGLLLTKDGKKLIAVPAGRTGSLTVPSSVENIGCGAFEESKLSQILFHPDANMLSFGYRAFFGADGIRTITIPASVVNIGYYAFAYCENLQEVIFADGNQLADIREGVFCGDLNLEIILLPDSVVEICDFAFYGCSKICQIPVSPNHSLLSIYDYAFAYTGLSGEFTPPESLVDIGNYAFMGNRFTKITIPDANKKLLRIGLGAFEDCNQVTEITLPFLGASFEDNKYSWLGYIFGATSYESNDVYVPATLKTVTLTEGLTTIYTGGFYNCWDLETIHVPNSVSVLWDHAFESTIARYQLTNVITGYTYDAYTEKTYLEISTHQFGNGLIGKLTISGDVPSVSVAAHRLTELVLMEGVSSIGYISGESLTSITIPSTVTSVADCALIGCPNLKQINLPENGGGAKFADGILYDYPVSKIMWVSAELPETVKILDGVTTIDDDTFYGKKGMQNLILPDSVTRIGNRAFYDCRELTNVTCSANLQTIGDEAFAYCSSLETFTNMARVTSIGRTAFGHCVRLKEITLPDTLVELGETAFSECSSLTSIVIPEGVTRLPYGVFMSCYGLAHITLPDTLTEIGDRAFEGCRFTYITIPASVTYISYEALNCQNLYMIINHSSLPIAMGDYTYGYYVAQAKCIIDANGNRTVAENTVITDDGFLFDTSTGEYVLRAYVGTTETVTLPTAVDGNPYRVYEMKGAVHVVIPEGTTSIDDYTFSGNDSLCSIRIPSSVTSIGNGAFSGCANLETITIPDTVTTMGSSLFSGCAKLRTVELPSNLTEIGWYMFSGCASLTNFVIPNGVTTIREYAFTGCRNLTHVTIPESVTTIESNAFTNCTSLESILLPSGLVDFVPSAFSGNTELIFPENCTNYTMVDGILYDAQCTTIVYVSPRISGHVTLPDTLTKIGEYAFRNCTALTGITIPSSVTGIGAGAFYGCSGLENIVIPETVTKLYDETFYGCSGLRTAVLPNGLKYLGSRAFFDCDLLDSVWTYGEASTEGSNDDWMYPWETGMKYDVFVGCNSLRSVQIPLGINNIGDRAFGSCENLTTVVLHDGVTSIGYSAFEYCEKLATIHMPESITTIGEGAFRYCTSLESITLGIGVTSIGADAFRECSALKDIIIPEENTAFCYMDGILYNNPATQIIWVSDQIPVHVTIPEGVTWISSRAFMQREGLISISLPSTLISIEDQAFAYCTGLNEIIIPNGVTRIGGWAFSGSGLMQIVIPDSVTQMGNGVFSSCENLISVQLPSGLNCLESDTFAWCSKLESIIIPDSITYIGSRAFYDCTNLKNITLPATLSSIYDGAFYNCSSLQSLVLPDGFVEVGSRAFMYCQSLKYVEFPESLLTIGDDAFFLCEGMLTVVNHSQFELSFGSWDHGSVARYAKILIDRDGNKYYYRDTYFETEDGFLFNHEDGRYTLLAYLGYEETITLPSQIKGSNYGLYQFRGAEHVILPDGFTDLDESAFSGSAQLKSIVLPDSITIIPCDAFARCVNLQSITLPANLIAIEDGAFMECRSLTEVTIPDGVERIGMYAFDGCWNLYTVHIPESVVKIGNNAFPVWGRESALFENPAYYQNGLLVIDGWLLYVDDTVDYVHHLDQLHGVVSGDVYMEVEYTIKSAPWCEAAAYLGNLVTAYLPQIHDEIYPLQNSVTLKNVVIGPDVYPSDLWNKQDLFAYATGLTIFVDALEEDLRWDDNFPGWNNGNTVVYADQWHWVNFYDETGRLVYSEPRMNVQINRLPFYEMVGDERYTYQLVGWDLDGDGEVDSIPATTIVDIDAYPVGIASQRQYVVQFVDQVTGVVYHEMQLPYGAVVSAPAKNPSKQGHDFVGWTLSDGTTVTGDMVIYALWLHHGGGHQYDQTIWVDATCDEGGHYLHTCSICDQSYATGWTEPLGHKYKTTVVAPTCTESGYTRYTCSTCGNTYDDDPMQYTGHSYGDWIIDQAPGCAVDGTRHHDCVICGHREDDIAAAKGHNFRESDLVDPTCVTQGSQKLCCVDCGLVVIEQLPMQDHLYEKQIAASEFIEQLMALVPDVLWGYEGESIYYYVCAGCGQIRCAEDLSENGSGVASVVCKHQQATWTVIRQPDCGGVGMENHICDDCGKVLASRTFGQQTEHKVVFHEGKAPTCTEPGWQPYESCENCDYTTYMELPAGGQHTYTSEITVAPGCETAGIMTYVCSSCGHSYTEQIPASGHAEEIMVGHSATCTEDGMTDGVFCTVCDMVLVAQEVIPATGHNYEVTGHDATCTEDGRKVYTCHCGDTYTEVIPAIGHHYDVVVTEPTCTEKGYTTHTCVNCGATYTDEHVEPLGHHWNEGVVTKEPTVEAEGEKTYTCTNCGETYVEILPKKPDVHYEVPEDNSVIIPENDCFEDGTTVMVEVIQEGETFQQVTNAMKHVAEQYVAYEFTAIKDNAAVQPNGNLVVTFAIPADYSANVAVYYMTENGTLEKLEAVVDAENRTITVELMHFSTYIIADQDTAPAFMIGDVNGDGKITTADARMILLYVVGKTEEGAVNELVADANGDGKITTADARMILLTIVGKN